MPTDVRVPELEPEPEPEPWKHLKLVAVGDSGVGKTSLLTTKMTGQFPEEWAPAHTMDCCPINLLVDGQPVSLDMWEAG